MSPPPQRRRPRGAPRAGVVAPLVAALWCAQVALAPVSAQTPRPAAVAPTAAGLDWRALNATQKRVLAPLADAWPTLGAEQQGKWVELANRFDRMSADEQRLVQERMREWAAMSPQDRRRARVQFQQTSQWSPQDRLERWQAYQSLPPEQRRALNREAERDAASRTTRRAPEPAAPKSVVVAPPRPQPTPPAAPAMVQAAPGATTRPVGSPEQPPRHQQAGLPKMAATPEFVDPNTLLPRRGAQAAPVREPAPQPRGDGKSR